MFGVIGVSPESGDISTFFADRHGGNMDDHVNGIGATVHLPVFQSGAQLAIGDMHASMGDGEISGTGVEIGGIGVIKVDVIKASAGVGPSPRRPTPSTPTAPRTATSTRPCKTPARRRPNCSSTSGDSARGRLHVPVGRGGPRHRAVLSPVAGQRDRADAGAEIGVESDAFSSLINTW